MTHLESSEPQNAGAPTAHRPAGGRALALATVVVLVAVLGLQSSYGRRLLHSAGLSGGNTAFTELYLTDASPSPSSPVSRQAQVTVGVAIRNETGVATVYHYSMAVVGNVTDLSSTSAAVAVPSGATQVVRPHASFVCDSGRVEHVVSLTSPSESVDMWVTCPPAGG